MKKLERCSRIISNPFYKECVRRTEEAERRRIFCRHNMDHFLDTARIGYIIILENHLPISMEMIYAAALVHDAARCEETPQVSHDETGARLAERVLPECGFTPEETALVAEAVRSHRRPSTEVHTLADVLYTADKLSRRCWDCSAADKCNWNSEKRNSSIIY